ncbi:hypothetical protein H6G81_07765 [Scytonema hofmannii FACHB-248]|uniref:RecC C-terminal domain-containing protein n=1 Tax=Scytonema hofmannii FACHB-248 TaxID=1842502 RepID=A0ABR8GLY5_9CYAN|nr:MULTISPECIES: contractile injection system tape measure protein [Nostocales]MBD2604429.1 hypothetical protein [Scytonema hofmannii FACHB-248]
MSKQRHIIGRTVLELDTGQIADVWSLQEDAIRLFQQQGVPAIERLFDQLVGDEEVVRLDRVVVEVGTIDRRFLADEFIHKLLDALSQTLGDRLVAGAKTEKITRDRIGSDWEVLLYFLRYGRLPWWCPNDNWQSWFRRWESAMQNNTIYRQTLRELLIINQAAKQRLVEQLPEPFLHQLILQVQPAWITWHTLLTQARQLMQSLELGSGAVRYLERQAWLLLFAEITSDHATTRPFPATWTRNWLAQLVQTWRENQSDPAGDSPQQAPTSLEKGNKKDQIIPYIRENPNEIAHQQLRAIFEALSIAESSLWLTALDFVLTTTTDRQTEEPDCAEEFVLKQIEPSDITSTPEANWEVLLYFLQSGRLPSEQASEDLLTWLPRWETVILTETVWQMPLRESLRNNVATQQRIVTQLPEGLRHQLVLQLQPAWTIWHTLLAQARVLMHSLSLSSDSFQELERFAWLLLFAEITLDNAPTRPFPGTWTRNWLAQLVQTWQQNQSDPAADSQQRSPMTLTETSRTEATELKQDKRYNYQETTNESDRQRLHTIIAAFPIAESSLWLTALDQVLTATYAQAIAPSQNWRQMSILQTQIDAAPPPQLAPNSTLSREEETAGLYVTQAGLVLLHPFLRFYLEAVGLWSGKSFRDESAQQMAIYLLYYLATKQTDAPEYELVLPKLLCGWSLNEPVVRGLDLPEAALSEGEHLLETAIAYWEALKNTSPSGLREGFLQREGKLTRSGDGNWKLQVEQQAIDILLSRLPWGLSMVTLPWMNQLLIVQWH